MNCPSKTCRIEIDDDSEFCDQCGSEILICPKCQTPGIGKFCPKDGHKLESRRSHNPGQTQTRNSQPETAAEKIPVKTESNIQNNNCTTRIEINNTSSVNELIIVHSSGVELKIKDRDLLGRSEGPHSQYLENFKYLSRQHAMIINNSGNWFIKDLGSTNKSRVNGNVLTPDVECLIKKGDKIVLADQEFTVK